VVVGMTQSDDWPTLNSMQAQPNGNWDGVIASSQFPTPTPPPGS
jgi:hypothetical protein